MTINQAQQALSTLSVGASRVINGKVVTHWARDVFEVGTWARGTLTNFQAAYIISGLSGSIS